MARKHHLSIKLSEDDVREIRRRYAEGAELQQALANDFEVCKQLISKIVNWQIWIHVGDEVANAETERPAETFDI